MAKDNKVKINHDEVTNQKVNYCEWCSKETLLGKTEQSETPILEFIEEKIDEVGRNEIWSEEGDWFDVDMDSDFEAELLVYDSLLSSIAYRVICTSCLLQDDMLYKKYYHESIKEINNDDSDDDDHYIIELE